MQKYVLGGLQSAILRLILEKGWAIVTPAMIRHAMRERGVDIKEDNIVHSLEGLVARGVLVKLLRGVYIVPENAHKVYKNSYVTVKSKYASRLFAKVRGDNGGDPGEAN